MRISIHSKMIASFLLVVIITGVVSMLVGLRLTGDVIIRQAQDKVRMDLNSARVIYLDNLEKVEEVIRLTSMRFFLRENLIKKDLGSLREVLAIIRNQEGLDILTLTDAVGRVIIRSRNPEMVGDMQNGLIRKVIDGMQPVSSTELFNREELIKEGEDLAERARTRIIPIPMVMPREEEEETSGMLMIAIAPVMEDDGRLLGVLYGGVLLNRKYEIVDKIKETVYQGEFYKGKDIGTATIFQGDLRISTNVTREDGSRAIGTQVSREVYDQVLNKGLPWIERAFVVNAWHITAYEPIRNSDNAIVGILYVGMLEERFRDMRRATMLLFLGVTLAGITGALILAIFLANGMLKPIKQLAFASHKLAEGDLDHRVRLESTDEIGELAKTFNFMAKSLKERDEEIKKYTQEKIMESKRLAIVGQLAAGVAHELNNPLGGILIYSRLLLEKLQENDPKKSNLEKIVTQATRCKKIVKGLLDFSRQTEPTIDPTDIGELIEKTLSLLENQAAFQNIEIRRELMQQAPKVIVDAAQIQQVFINIILNAAEAMGKKEKGTLTIGTRLSDDKKWMEILFTDNGYGIPGENLDRLFEPFFTTKEVGKGTGLGLAISYGIIRRHQGNIEVKSKAGEGTTFIVKLPVISESL